MRWSANWFTIVFSLVYGLVFAFELPVLAYYPLTGVWSFDDVSQANGTVMHWYGLTGTAVACGALAGMGLPDGLMPRMLRRGVIAAAWVLMLVCTLLLRSFFGLA